ncbi:hypothetical protein [Leptolyngbya sp. NIES-2104]|uniref:hypothetical protein n=1 Tax=Leptolyngbya sp. NIES-2104 TaxID=1552121 RepID=UPI00073EB16A|nr:hypothetical protein [Leptolyngbya sp. NIES-2104]
MNSMNADTLSVIFKVMGASLLIAIAIKYLAPFVEIEPTTFNVLLAVLSPTTILATVLLASLKNG